MVVAILIATMTFQAGVNPPGGVWQQDGKNHLGNYWAGKSVIASNQVHLFKTFLAVNTVAFMMSLSTILLLISGLPFRRRIFAWVLMVVMWKTINAVVVTYAKVIVVVTPVEEANSLGHVALFQTVVWAGVMSILFIGNTVRLIVYGLKRKGIIIWQPQRFRSLFGVNNV